MLIALYMWFHLTFGGAVALSDRIEDAVEDPTRLTAALVVAEEMEDLEQRLVDQTRATHEALLAVHRRFDATRQDYLDALRPLDLTRREVTAGLLAGRKQLRAVLTRAEWAEIFPPAE